MLDFEIILVIAIIIVIALFLIVTKIFPHHPQKRKTTIPGPDITDEKEGNLPDITASGSLHEYLRDIHAKYGPIVTFWYGQQMCVSIASPQLFKESATLFDRPKIFYKMIEPLITPHAIQYAHGAEARNRHTNYNRCFSHENISKKFDILYKLSLEFSEKWANLPKEEHIPLGQYMTPFAIRSVLAVAFGMFFRDDKQVLEFKKAYDFTWSEMESRLLGDLPDDKRLETFEKCTTQMMDLLWKAVEVAKNKPTDETQFVEVVQNLGLSEDVIKADMMTVCIGGFHTTGLLLTWAVYFLANHKEYQEKAYNELEEILGDEPLRFDAIARLIYLKQVLDETLRCSILAPHATRYHAEADIELGGHKVPDGTPVIQALGVLQEDENLWPDPLRFDPGRFSEENRKKIPTFGFEPFGFAGKRRCPGYRLSHIEATVLLAELIRRFKFSLVEGQDVKREYGLMTKPKEEVWITLENRRKHMN